MKKLRGLGVYGKEREQGKIPKPPVPKIIIAGKYGKVRRKDAK